MCTERKAPVYSEGSDLKAEVWVFSRVGGRQALLAEGTAHWKVVLPCFPQTVDDLLYGVLRVGPR